MEINKITSRKDLADLLGITLQQLTFTLYEIKPDSYYKTFEVPKKNGGFRVINAPTGILLNIQKILSKELYKYNEEIRTKNNIKRKVSHGFELKRNVITNAEVHVNKLYVLNMDIENFFDSFHFGRIRGYFHKNNFFNLPVDMATVLAQLTCYDGSLPQGAPTSPVITNLLCNILDMRLIKLAKKFKLEYTRYADDLTFSTNDHTYQYKENIIIDNITKIVNDFGLNINHGKTRINYKNSRQVVTGLTVNKKVNISRDYYRKTRAMAHNLYQNGEFYIDNSRGSLKQLEGRLSFINQIEYYNNNLKKNNGLLEKKEKTFHHFSSKELEFQKFLFYKYFFNNPKPLIITEGKTDVLYLKAALKKYYLEYPNLISKKGNDFHLKISFLRKSKRLQYFLKLEQNGADTFKNIFNFYTDNSNKTYPNLSKYFNKKSSLKPSNPLILLFDNEQHSNKPLSKFINHIKRVPELNIPDDIDLSFRIIDNLYLLTNPLVDGKKENEIEDLFDSDTLSLEIEGKYFTKNNIDTEKHFGKHILSNYIYDNYRQVDFEGFKPLLDRLNQIVTGYTVNDSKL